MSETSTIYDKQAAAQNVAWMAGLPPGSCIALATTNTNARWQAVPASQMEVAAMKDKVLKWMLNGRVGLSSKAMAAHLCGFPCEGDYPIDPDDFNRCMMFLDAVPEARALLPKMAEVNRYWAALVSRWDEIEAAFRDERRGTCLFYSAPKTYKLITEIINKAYKAETARKE
jgi:hypothetical protein